MYDLVAPTLDPSSSSEFQKRVPINVKLILTDRLMKPSIRFEIESPSLNNSNQNIIDEYIFDVMNVVRPSTGLEVAYESNLVFEAIIENKDLKVKLLSQINNNSKVDPWFFTNTSSVPINIIESEAGLTGKIIGFHFPK